MKEETKNKQNIDSLFNVGAHFGFGRSRRHPSVDSYIFCTKNRVDIFDLEKTDEFLKNALDFVALQAKQNNTILLVGGKNEAQLNTKDGATKIDMPYVAGRWIGGTLTNFPEIRKRIDEMVSLETQKEKGELSKYTKKERLLINKKIEKLEKLFGGIKNMTTPPKAIFIVDPRFEKTALREAKRLKIPVIALCGSDNDISEVDFPITANDSNIQSIKYFIEKIVETYKNNLVK